MIYPCPQMGQLILKLQLYWYFYGVPNRSKLSTSFMRPQLHLCLLNFIYACSTSFMPPQLHLCLLNFIYASSTSFMLAQLHLCLLNFIYAPSTSFMPPQRHLCLLNFIYACSTSFMLAQLHLCVLNFIHASSTSFTRPQLFSPCSTLFTMLNFFHHAQLFHFLHSSFYQHYSPLRDCVILIPTGMGVKV